jgi:alkanesulfonate monooxygenase SsuD/methylene tetrahydromethanopterin reductase-like flavin-dependent oxidoreductase (luciferase family)
MDLGLHYWTFSAPGDPRRIADTLAAAAKTAEEAGVAEFSVMDHYFQLVDDKFDDNHDDNGSLNHHPYGPQAPLSCLVTAPARSWPCGGHGFESR